ncbi:MAG: recombinase family protein [Candidatus Binatia bacterium]
MALGRKAVTRADSEPIPAPKSVGIWVRVSTEDQAAGESPEHHEKRARYYAEAKGWTVAELYNLAGVSGKAVLDHPEAKRMLADVKSGHISGLIFSKLARLARNTRELLDIADLFRDLDADLVSLGEAIDTSSPAGRLFFTMIAAMAQFEREEIASRVAASVPIRAKLGKPLGGAAPFGFQWKDRKLIPDPENVPLVKLVFSLFSEHRRKKTVARLLNEAGHRTRSGAKFSDTTVDRILRDPVAKGRRRANYTRSTGDKKHWVHKPETEWVFSDVEPIILADLFDQVNAVLDAQREKGKRPAKRTVHLFAGVTFCGCGNKMYVPSNTPKYVCYKCRNKIPVEDLEAVFHDQLKSFVFAPTEIERYLEAADKAIAEKADVLRVLEREAAKTEKERSRVMRLYLDEAIDQENFVRDHRPLEERLKQLGEEMPQLEGEIDFLKIQRLSGDQILSEAKDLHGRWSELEREEKRHVIEQITSRITVSDGEVEIDLCYLPVSSQVLTERQRNRTDSSRRRA